MTYSVLAIGLTCFISGLLLALAHYFPMKRIFGFTMEKPYTYVVGVTFMLAPVAALYGYWSVFAPLGNAFNWALAGLLANIATSGLVMLNMYHADADSMLRIEAEANKTKASELEAFRHGERSDDE